MNEADGDAVQLDSGAGVAGAQQMLCRFTKLQGSRIVALDGEVGKVWDLYFDDVEWVVRYLIVDTGGWLPGRKVLVAPQAVDSMDHTLHAVSACLTRERIRGAPDIDTDKPVSRQHETEFNRYYGYAIYWSQPFAGTVPLQPTIPPNASDLLELQERRLADATSPAETHLRSMREVCGYSISAADDSVGHVKDFLFDDETWHARYLVVETGSWLFGRRVLVGQASVQQVDWPTRSVEVSRTRAEIEHGCEFDPDHPPLGDLEIALRRAAAQDRPGP